MRILITTLSLVFASVSLIAGPGDTTIVQTFTFDAQNNPDIPYDSPGRRWFQFPSGDTEYQKVLMYYTLKCFEDGTAGGLGFPCGEWDYLTYTYLFEHTGALDSNLVTHPNYLANNLDFDAIDLTSTPRTHTYQYPQIERNILNVISEEELQIGGLDMEIASVFQNANRSRIQFLYTVDELYGANFQEMSNIDKLSLYANGPMDELSRFEIKIGNVDATELSGFLEEGMVTVYTLDHSIEEAGWHDFLFQTTFMWDGASDIAIEFSYANDVSPAVPTFMGYSGGENVAIHSAGNDKYLHFDWNDEVRVPPAAFSALSDEITISFWQFGDPEQPQDGTVLEGVNAQNQRVLNVHAPWSNGRIYWDAGWNGGYDRIDKQANTQDYEGRWNHWAFVKDANAGVMQIYLNGQLWHSGTNLDNLMEGIAEFSLGGATGWSNFYRGSIDEFALFDVALDATTITEWMNRDLDASMPYWDNLLVYYQFNENDGESIVDASGNGFHGQMHGNAGHKWHDQHTLWRNLQFSNQRPAIIVGKGDYESEITTSFATYNEIEPLISLAEFDAENYVPIVTDIEYWTVPGYAYTYDINGLAIDSVWVAPEINVVNGDFEYYQAPYEVVHRHEL
ncbi:MAG: LamG domain-containing protein, partial [Flavobacteriales bacterium]|nr:LamG domain-containing protein [Flavobacteriales bacterium]